MSRKLIEDSPDLKRLRDEGYELEVHKGGHALVHHVPYLNSAKEIKYGVLISTLTLNDNVTIKPDNHVMFFMGEYPCNNDGSQIEQLRHGEPKQELRKGIVMNYSFSNKPEGTEGYANYYDKFMQYIQLISAPAKSIDPNVRAQTHHAVVNIEESSVFVYVDTNSSRANIHNLTAKFEGLRIGIIGLGGTGSYILDAVAKTPVQEIHIWDEDVFIQHNAFRAPGAPSVEQLKAQQKKVDYFYEIYSRMHKGIVPHQEYITDANIGQLKDYSFIFLCVDKNIVRNKIIAKLIEYGIPLIDVGMGVELVNDALIGILRATVITSDKYDHLERRVGSGKDDNDEYASNIQISDLNELNAMLAIIKWKKMIGFYHDLTKENNITYTINTGQLDNEERTV